MSKGELLVYGNFVVHPEYCGLDKLGIAERSKDGRYHVASAAFLGENCVFVFCGGKLLYQRPKFRLYHSEVRDGFVVGRPPEVVVLDSKRVLILICYELVFPGDYVHLLSSVDLVVHLVGVPMFSEEQREGWVALQQMVSLVGRCPLVCCCGGHLGRMNLTGVIEESES